MDDFEDEAIVFFSGSLLRKSPFFGLWEECFCEVREAEFVILNNSFDRLVERKIPITSTTEATIDEQDKSTFNIKTNDISLDLKTDSADLAFQWVTSIKSAIPQKKAASINDFYILSVIGRGYFGKVLLCQRKGSDSLYAIKTVKKSQLINTKNVHTIFYERNILLQIKHPFIVKLSFAFQSDTKFYLGMEYVPGGDLFNYIKNERVLPPEQVKLYAAEIGLALSFLHEKGIIYRDLKPENILIDEEGHVKLTDFGLAKHIDRSTTSTFCGTVDYLAPEIIRGEKYSTEVDWWAYGCLIYELLLGSPPFVDPHTQNVFQKIQNEDPPFPDDFDASTKDFLLRFFEKDPSKRASFSTLKDHDFWDLDFDDVYERKITPIYIPDIDDMRIPDNFDHEITMEDPRDTIAMPAPNHDTLQFVGFSFTGSLKRT